MTRSFGAAELRQLLVEQTVVVGLGQRVIDYRRRWLGIQLNPVNAQDVKALPRTEARVFPVTSNAMRKAFNYARKKAGLTHFRFHDTRHERISSLFEAGWAMPQVMAQSGHRDPKSVMRYTNLSGNYLANELAKLG